MILFTRLPLRIRILLTSIIILGSISLSFIFFNLFVSLLIVSFSFILTIFIANKAVKDFNSIYEDINRTDLDPDYRIVDRGPREIYRITRLVNRLSGRLSSQRDYEYTQNIKLNSILNGMKEGVIVVKTDGFIDYINPIAMDLLNIDQTSSDIYSTRLSNLNNNPELNEIISNTIKNSKSCTAELEFLETNSYILVSTSVIFTSENNNDVNFDQEIIVLLTDLTFLRRLNITRREFISNASHELRTPIAAIKSSSETLKMGAHKDPKVSKKFLDLIFDDAIRMENLVSELMELTRLESGDVILKKINISPIVLVENSYKRFSQICEDNEISLVIDKNLPNKELLVSVDTDKIDQVFANLINNAIKWTDEGGEIKFSFTEKETSLDINIIDNGSGISSDDLPHIFERFFKTDSSRSQDGTGLGLSICNHIMELHGGEISVESSEGIGSTFTISLTKISDQLTYS